MGKMPSKAADNIYCKARLEAAKYNPAFASREGAANEIFLIELPDGIHPEYQGKYFSEFKVVEIE